MSKKRIVTIFIEAVVFCVIAYFCYSLIAGWYQGNIEELIDQEREACQEQTETLKGEIASLEEKINELKGQTSSQDKIEEVFGKGSSLLSLKQSNMTYEDIESQIIAFFAYLDERGYVEENNLTGSTYNQYESAVNDLSLSVPIISGETENLHNLFRNIAHFYRVLGKERLFLVRDILKNESDIIESAMKTFFIWYTYEDGTEKRIKGRPSFQVLYDYAGFFLTTLGGKSYLFRRDSDIRILTTFYCIMIIDMANDKKLNSNGIDIRPYIKMNFNDITYYMGLVDQNEYLMVLESLEVKYKIS